MRNLIVAALTAALLTAGAGGLPSEQQNTRQLDSRPVVAAGANQGPCDEDRYDVKPRMGHEKVARKVGALIRCAVRRWDVSGGASKALDVAECESGLWPWAIGGDNLGIFQHKAKYWLGRVNAYLRRRWFSDFAWERIHQAASVSNPGPAFLARANVLVAVQMVHRGGWGPWSCA